MDMKTLMLELAKCGRERAVVKASKMDDETKSMLLIAIANSERALGLKAVPSKQVEMPLEGPQTGAPGPKAR